MAKGQRALLPPEEEQHLRELTSSGAGSVRQRAQIVLDWQQTLARAGILVVQDRCLMVDYRAVARTHSPSVAR